MTSKWDESWKKKRIEKQRHSEIHHQRFEKRITEKNHLLTAGLSKDIKRNETILHLPIDIILIIGLEILSYITNHRPLFYVAYTAFTN